MTHTNIRFTDISDDGDYRGTAFAVPDIWADFLRTPRDLHVTSIRPGHVRGNHFHVRRREALLVIYQDSWSFAWDSGDRTPIASRDFEGSGAVLVEIEPLVAHAIENNGSTELRVIGISSASYDSEQVDSFPRQLIAVRA